MRPIEIEYRARPIVVATLFFVACALWLYAGPSTSGATGRLLGTDQQLSIIGIAAVIASVGLAAIFGIHVVRMLMGRPAIKVDATALSVYVVPFRRFNRSDIESVDYDASAITIRTTSGAERRIRAPLLRNYNDSALLLKAELG